MSEEHPAIDRARKLVAMAAAGKLDKQIAHELGCHKQYVLGARKALGIVAPAQRRRYPAELREQVMAAVNGGMSKLAAARKFGVNVGVIYYALRKQGSAVR